MALKFNFNISLKPKRQTRSPSNISYSVIESKVEGLIKVFEDMTFRVEYKGKLYKITQESFNTKGRIVLYARKLDC